MSAPALHVRGCDWCGTPMEAPEATGPAWCCGGCEGAAALVSGAGLDRYFASRTAWAPRPRAPDIAWERLPVQRLADGRCEIALHVDGISCLACVSLIEGLLGRTPGVTAVHVNHATGRTRLAWDPELTDLGRLAGRVTRLGYGLRPLASSPSIDTGLLWRLGFACFAGANLMMVHVALYLGWFEGMAPAWARLLQWTALALATPVALWSASPFHTRALAGLRERVLHMDLPISVAVWLSWGHGVWATLHGREGYLDSLGMLVALLLTGRWLEERSRRARSAAAEVLAARLPTSARRLQDGALLTVSPDQLVPGDRLSLATGEVLAADGEVVHGQGRVHQALLTGESEPVPVAPGDTVLAGTQVIAGSLEIQVSRAGHDTLLRRMEATLAGADDTAADTGPAERLAPAFTAATLGLATAAGVGWGLGAGPAAGVEVATAVLVVACPCALALSGPLSALAGTAAAARGGLLVRSASALRRLATVDQVVVDKTGTLTTGRLQVLAAADAVLRVAAGLARASIHPIAIAILEEARRRGIALPRSEGVMETAGQGVSGRVDGRAWRMEAGGPGEVQIPGLGTIRLGDQLRDDAAAVVGSLADRGLPVTLLSGDRQDVADHIGAQVGATESLGATPPEGKQAWLQDRADAGHRVLFVGDGLNDGPALRAAWVGVAMHDGAPSSVLAADAVALGDGLSPVLRGLDAARSAVAAQRLALRGALLYNAAAVALALTGRVDPLVAALLMPLSNLAVLWVCGRPLRQAAP